MHLEEVVHEEEEVTAMAIDEAILHTVVPQEEEAAMATVVTIMDTVTNLAHEESTATLPGTDTETEEAMVVIEATRMTMAMTTMKADTLLVLVVMAQPKEDIVPEDLVHPNAVTGTTELKDPVLVRTTMTDEASMITQTAGIIQNVENVEIIHGTTTVKTIVRTIVRTIAKTIPEKNTPVAGTIQIETLTAMRALNMRARKQILEVLVPHLDHLTEETDHGHPKDHDCN